MFEILILGLIMGSFLGVVIDRVPNEISFIDGRSKCNSCDYTLSFYELIPVLSYLMQKGKCNNCNIKLSLRHPFLEILTAGLYYLCYLKYGFTINLVFALCFASILIVIAFIDFDTMVIYDQFHLMIFMLGVIEAYLLKKNLLYLIVASLLISIPFFIIALSTKGLGGGDVKLMFASGFYIGVPKILVSFAISVILGGSYALYSLITKKYTKGDAIPFAPFLCVGLYISMLYGSYISTWYLSLLS